MSDTREKTLKVFVFVTLLGLACFTGLIELTAHSTREVMLPVMALYFSGIGFTSVGGVGIAVILVRRAFRSKPESKISA